MQSTETQLGITKEPLVETLQEMGWAPPSSMMPIPQCPLTCSQCTCRGFCHHPSSLLRTQCVLHTPHTPTRVTPPPSRLVPLLTSRLSHRETSPRKAKSHTKGEGHTLGRCQSWGGPRPQPPPHTASDRSGTQSRAYRTESGRGQPWLQCDCCRIHTHKDHESELPMLSPSVPTDSP